MRYSGVDQPMNAVVLAHFVPLYARFEKEKERCGVSVASWYKTALGKASHRRESAWSEETFDVDNFNTCWTIAFHMEPPVPAFLVTVIPGSSTGILVPGKPRRRG